MCRSLYNNPNQYASEIISLLQLSPPIDIDKICKFFDINVNYEPLKSAEALLIVSNGKKNILINSNKFDYDVRKRSTIAHEIGHLFIPWHSNLQNCDNTIDFDSDDKYENEANALAMELLIPERYILDDINDKEISFELIKELAKKYNVSLNLMCRRIINYSTNATIAFLYYSNGKKYIQVQSESFIYKLKEGVIEESLAYKFFRNSTRCIEAKQVVSANLWLDTEEKFNILEESIYQPNYNRVFTMLKLVSNEVEDLCWE